MKKKGFTLTELLAVIVILAIIALIATPLILGVIEKAKIGSLESSVNGLVESANMYYANETIKGETLSETIFDFEDGVQTSTKKLEYKGKVYNGKLILHVSGEVAVCIDDNKYYAYKNKDSDEVISGIGTCLYDGTTGDFSSNNSSADDLTSGLNSNLDWKYIGGVTGTTQIPIVFSEYKEIRIDITFMLNDGSARLHFSSIFDSVYIGNLASDTMPLYLTIGGGASLGTYGSNAVVIAKSNKLILSSVYLNEISYVTSAFIRVSAR